LKDPAFARAGVSEAAVACPFEFARRLAHT
jgi:hypothetical protein